MIAPDSVPLQRTRSFGPLAIALLLCAAIASPARASSWAVEMARTVMERYPDPWTFPYLKWCYPHGHLLEGYMKLRRYTGDRDGAYYNYILKYANEFVDANGNLSNFQGNSTDDMLAGVTICWAYDQTKQERFRTAAARIRNAFNNYPRTSDGAFFHYKGLTGEFWIDGVFMGQMFLIRYGKYVGDSTYCYNEAAKQLKLARKYLLKTPTNLLYHAWDENKDASWANRQTGLSPEVWSEGLGWYSNILVEALEALPANHPDRDTLEEHLDSLASALRNYQDTSGGWWWIVDKARVGKNFLDISGSSFFVYCLQKGIDLGLLNPAVYGPVVRKGFAFLNANAAINAENRVDLAPTCDGTGVQSSFDAYVNCWRWKNSKESIAAFLWACGIVEKPGATATGPRTARANAVPIVSHTPRAVILRLPPNLPESARIRVTGCDGRCVAWGQEIGAAPGPDLRAIVLPRERLPGGIYCVIVNDGNRNHSTLFAVP